VVIGTDSGETAVDLLSQEHFDLLITDLRLPSIDGIQVMSEARTIDPDIAVIILTGAASLHSAIAATNYHAHCYLLKPTRGDELLRSVGEALERRNRIAEPTQSYQAQRAEQAQAEEPIIQIGPLRIDPSRHHVTCNGRALRLTSGEFALLTYLAQQRGAVVSTQEIARAVLNYSCSPQEARNLARNRIHSLRLKIKSTGCTRRIIQSIYGTGYRIAEDDDLEL
jgi:DNA-binding response OmpR family regulator